MRFFAALLCGLSAVSAFMPAMESTSKVSVVNSNSLMTPGSFQSYAADYSAVSCTQLNAMATGQKLYPPEAKETPKVFGGIRAALKELVVITGASSGLGLSTTIALCNSGDYHVIMACRNTEKAKKGEFFALETNDITHYFRSFQPLTPFFKSCRIFQSPRKTVFPRDLTPS